MIVNGKRVLLCNCDNSMPLDGAGVARALGGEAPVIHSQLCRGQIEAFRQAAAEGRPLIVGCTQEAPLFGETAGEGGAPLAFVNIREHAGWSDDARNAGAKIAALLAEAALEMQPTPSLSLTSRGMALVYGDGQQCLDAARQLGGRLAVTCLLRDPTGALPPARGDTALYRGVIRRASGHLGAFTLTVDGFAPAKPSARAELGFAAGRDDATAYADLVVDLSGGPPLFPGHRRDGYLRADPRHPTQVQRVLFDALDLVGDFEKPRYVRVETALCAHSRSGKTGCTRCLDVCPTAAILPAGDHVAVDARACDGHGACASVCPTGAIRYDLPAGDGIAERLGTLLRRYHAAGGRSPVLLVHDPRWGEEAITLMARHGRGLPAHVIPFAVNEITQFGFDQLTLPLALGAVRVLLLAGPEQRDLTAALAQNCALADAVSAGLGYGDGRFAVVACTDPMDLEELLWRAPLPAPAPMAEFSLRGGRRTLTPLILEHLHAHAPAPVDLLALPEGAPFGAVVVDDRCTLCLSCVGACPTGALGDNPERPQLSFAETSCVQCGLCRTTCPENAVTLVPRLDFRAGRERRRVLREEEPFCCISCGKPFGARSTIEKMTAKLTGHAMFTAPGRLDMIKMCSDCRVVAEFSQPAPMAGRPRPAPRTTDDYLRERDG